MHSRCSRSRSSLVNSPASRRFKIGQVSPSGHKPMSSELCAGTFESSAADGCASSIDPRGRGAAAARSRSAVKHSSQTPQLQIVQSCIGAPVLLSSHMSQKKVPSCVSNRTSVCPCGHRLRGLLSLLSACGFTTVASPRWRGRDVGKRKGWVRYLFFVLLHRIQMPWLNLSPSRVP